MVEVEVSIHLTPSEGWDMLLALCHISDIHVSTHRDPVLIRAKAIVAAAAPRIRNEPIASIVAEQVGCAYADIRAHGADEMTTNASNQAIRMRPQNAFGATRRVMVIVGEAHRVDVARILSECYGWLTESWKFPPEPIVFVHDEGSL